MKKMILPLIFISLFTSFSSGQKFPDHDSGKYSIHLPDYWKPGSPIWKVLADRLPAVCEKLKGKELCKDNCDPEYSIEFEMTDPIVSTYKPGTILLSKYLPPYGTEIQTFSFECSLLLKNKENEVLDKLIMIDPNEEWLLIEPENVTFAMNTPKTLFIPHLPTPDELSTNKQKDHANYSDTDKQANLVYESMVRQNFTGRSNSEFPGVQTTPEPLATININSPQASYAANRWRKLNLTREYMFELIDKRINSW